MISDTLGKVVLGALGTAVTGSLALGGAGSVEMLGVPVEQLETMTPGALTVDPAAMGTHPLGAHVVTVEDGVVRKRHSSASPPPEAPLLQRRRNPSDLEVPSEVFSACRLADDVQIGGGVGAAARG